MPQTYAQNDYTVLGEDVNHKGPYFVNLSRKYAIQRSDHVGVGRGHTVTTAVSIHALLRAARVTITGIIAFNVGQRSG